MSTQQTAEDADGDDGRTDGDTTLDDTPEENSSDSDTSSDTEFDAPDTAVTTGYPEDETVSCSQINVTAQGQRFLRIPELHLTTAGFAEGEKVGVNLVNFNGRLCLSITERATEGNTRKLRPSQRNRDEVEITIPKYIALGADLTGAEITYNSNPGCIIVITEHTPRITGKLTVYNTSEITMSQWASKAYPLQIPTDISDHVTPGEEVWFWYDVLSDGFIFGIDVDEENTMENAISLTVQETEQKSCDYLIRLPKTVCEALHLDGSVVEWGHDKNRILGLLKSP